jgi:hypothetical protein
MRRFVIWSDGIHRHDRQQTPNVPISTATPSERKRVSKMPETEAEGSKPEDCPWIAANADSIVRSEASKVL